MKAILGDEWAEGLTVNRLRYLTACCA